MKRADQDHRDIFGAESDEEPEQNVPSGGENAGDGGDDAIGGDDAGGGKDAGGEAPLPSVPRREVNPEELAAAPRPRKKKAVPRDGDGAGPTPGGDDYVEDDEETQPSGAALARSQVDAQIEAALKPSKRRSRRRHAGEDDLEMIADEEVSSLRADMISAADEDEEAKRLKQPATAKLRLLPTVMNTLQKTHLQQAILDNNLLEGVKRWLEPLPDKSLPALNIQRQLFSVLESMSIDTISLKMSGLGRVVVFYSLSNRVETQIRRTAEHLIEVWSRPILKRSASYRDRHVVQAEWHQDSPHNVSSQLSAVQPDNSARRNVLIPPSVSTGFQVAPRNQVGGGTDVGRQSRVANHQRCVPLVLTPV